MIRVCFLSTHAYGLFAPGGAGGEIGGAEVQFRYLATELARDKGFQPVVITGEFGQAPVEEHDGVRLYRAPTPRPSDGPLRRLGHAVRYYRLLRRVDADVYVTTAATTNILLVALFCRRHGRKHVHRTAHEREIGELHRRRGLMPALYRAGFRRADLIVTQHEAHRDALARNTGVAARVLRNGFPVADRPVADEGRRHVLWVGRCLPWKRPEAFLSLAARFPAHTFVMVAPGVPADHGADASQGAARGAPATSFARAIAERATRMTNVRLLGGVPFDAAQDLFDRALAFVNTSEEEGFPNTFLQAGLAKTPIVSLRVDPAGALSRGAGHVCGDSQDEMARVLALLLENAAERRKSGAAAFRYVSENHDLAGVVEEFKRIVTELTRRNAPRATAP
ncbi:MAG: glycosyltransferase family 4 protein [Lentisphaerae bacterium]|nr:glycosyltransferase family 4 protein [Lentisphaerota bacterium]